MLLNLSVREFRGFVGKQADQESGKWWSCVLPVLPASFLCCLSNCRRELKLICFGVGRVQGHCHLLNLSLLHWTCSEDFPAFLFWQKTMTLFESVSCLDSSVQSSRVVGRCFEGVQTEISDGDGCAGSLQRMVGGLKASKPLAGFWGQPE